MEKRKEAISNWFKDKNNLIFFGIIIIGIIIRIYHFILTKQQPLWWDESDYLAYAKNLAGFNNSWIVTAKHNSLFPFLVALLFRIGFSEISIKFVLETLPSIFLIFVVYGSCKLMYSDKRIALIASFLTATFWSILFNSTRFHVGIPALLFGISAIYVFFQGYEKKQKIFGAIDPKWAIPLTVLFVVLCYSIRRGYILFAGFFLIYMLFTRKFTELLKDKYNWVGLGTAIITLFIAESFIFIDKIGSVAGGYYHPEDAFNWKHLGVFDLYFSNVINNFPSVLLYLVYIGLALVVFNIFLSLGYFKKTKDLNLKSDLFLLISLIVTLGYFIFFQRGTTIGEARWYFPITLSLFVFIAKGSIFLGDLTKKYHKYLSIIIIVLLIGFGGYYEFKQGDMIIKSKVSSFNGIKQAGLFLKENSSPDSLIIARPQPQTSYYSERDVMDPYRFIDWNGSMKDVPFDKVLEKIKETPNANYIIVTFSEPGHPPWMRTDYQDRIEIPFMDTIISKVSDQHTIKESKTYGDIEFRLLTIKEDAFIYEIVRN